jgi:hypothetical protein
LTLTSIQKGYDYEKVLEHPRTIRPRSGPRLAVNQCGSSSTRTWVLIADDAGALAVLHVYGDRGFAEIIEIIGCIYSSGKVPYGAGVVEAINIYYGRPEIPIGAARPHVALLTILN